MNLIKISDPPQILVNYRAVPKGHATKIIHVDGTDFPTIRSRRRGKEVYYHRVVRRSFQEQYKHALDLMDSCFDILEGHQRFVVAKTSNTPPVCPDWPVECRDKIDFESCNWSR